MAYLRTLLGDARGVSSVEYLMLAAVAAATIPALGALGDALGAVRVGDARASSTRRADGADGTGPSHPAPFGGSTGAVSEDEGSVGTAPGHTGRTYGDGVNRSSAMRIPHGARSTSAGAEGGSPPGSDEASAAHAHGDTSVDGRAGSAAPSTGFGGGGGGSAPAALRREVSSGAGGAVYLASAAGDDGVYVASGGGADGVDVAFAGGAWRAEADRSAGEGLSSGGLRSFGFGVRSGEAATGVAFRHLGTRPLEVGDARGGSGRLDEAGTGGDCGFFCRIGRFVRRAPRAVMGFVADAARRWARALLVALASSSADEPDAASTASAAEPLTVEEEMRIIRALAERRKREAGASAAARNAEAKTDTKRSEDVMTIEDEMRLIRARIAEARRSADEGSDAPEVDEPLETPDVTTREGRVRLVGSVAADRGIENPLPILGIAQAETSLVHCWSDAQWACAGPPSPSCGGGPVIAGGGDGPCSHRQGGLGMFQLDGGTYDETLARDGERVLSAEGNIDAGIDFVVAMVIRSDYVNAADEAEAAAFLNEVKPGTAEFDAWIKTVTHYYNGCVPGKCGIYAERSRHYHDSAMEVVAELGELASPSLQQ